MLLSDFPIISDHEAKFEDVNIYFHKIGVSLSRITPEENVLKLAFTQIYDDLEVHYINESGRGLVGGMIIYFMSQGEENGLMLTFITNLSAISESDSQSASVYAKTVQYIFDWVKDFIKQNNIKDSHGKLFARPAFLYSKEDFIRKFPD